MVNKPLRYQVSASRFPLAMYREAAAHLRQVEGLMVDLISQTSQEFDYYQSQVGGLLIEYTDSYDPVSQERVDEILAYYQLREDTNECSRDGG